MSRNGIPKRANKPRKSQTTAGFDQDVSPVTVSVVGLGKLGACMAAAMASRGVPTIGVDVNADAVNSIRRKRAPVFEPGLAELIGNTNGLLNATTDIATAIQETQITFVVVPTPSNREGAFSLGYVCSAMEQIGRALRIKFGYHTVVLTSTVLPGSTEYVVKPLLEEVSGRQCGPDFGLCYSPEFIALGSVLRDFLNPDLLLIGECDDTAGVCLESFYRKGLRIEAPAKRMAPVNAELAKIALNTYVTTKITFANLLAELCERVPGGDVDAVTEALGMDRRIGARYLKGALGYGGPCFPRDNHALACLMEEVGVPADLPRAVDRLNRLQPGRVVSMVDKLTKRTSERIAVLGLAYKPDTNVVEESQGIAIALGLIQRGYKVSVFDPAANDAARRHLGDSVSYADTIADCIGDAGVIVLATDWPEFRNVLSLTADRVPAPIIIDGWRTLRDQPVSDDVSYRAIGLNDPNRDAQEHLRQFVVRLTGGEFTSKERGEPRAVRLAQGS